MWNQEPARQDDRGRPPQPASRPEERRVTAWVAKSVVFKGELISSEDMTIDGRVEGTIEIPEHRLTVGPDADIRADILAKTVIVMGAVTGSITAHEMVDIHNSGAVHGDVLSPKLSMADGALLRGRVETGGGRAVPEKTRSEVATT